MIKGTEPYISTKDFLVSGDSFDLLYNKEFDMLVTHPQPNSEKIGRYYESSEYISHTDEHRSIVSFLYQNIKAYTLKSKVKYIQKCSGKIGRILDIGAGTGDFLVSAKNSGWKVDGVEVNKLARDKALIKGINLNENLDDLKDQKYDIITLWHVLEHLPNLEMSLKKIDSLLKPTGILVIAVPNFRSFDAKYYSKYWAAFDVPRHFWHFSKNSVTKLLPDNYVRMNTKAMIFDSFYVSLLSEKYKSGSAFSIKALFIGLCSNIKALRTKEYSSLIYTFKKEV